MAQWARRTDVRVPEGRRTDAVMEAEHLGEVARLAVAGAPPDLRDRQVGGLQQDGGVLQADGGELVAKRAAGLLGEDALELTA
jgi:hypothetical protein